MNRLGITIDEAVAIAPRLQSENHGFTLLMSHLACAETLDHPMNEQQIWLFREIRILIAGWRPRSPIPRAYFSAAPCTATWSGPGLALRGQPNPPGRENPMRPVVELQGRIIQVRTVASGRTVGCGAAFTAGRASRVAIVAVGYADGFLRSAAAARGKAAAQVVVAGRRCPIAGRISMDLLAVDVTDLAEGARAAASPL